MSDYRICNRCVMNNSSDNTISFDKNGNCNYCTDALCKSNDIYFPNKEGEEKLNRLLKTLKTEGKNKKYDCIMGISGGLDSSYLAYLGASEWGLRIKAVHIDDGYDTEISKKNINLLCNTTERIDINIIKPDREQYNNLLKSYILAGVPNITAPQDNMLFAYLYDFARKNKIRYFLSGGNFALESILQDSYIYDNEDSVNIKDINKNFINKPVNKLKFRSRIQKVKDQRIHGIKTWRPLNYIDYNREKAFKELKEFCGFEYYGNKHLENDLTAFAQLYWFPVKFGVDKRSSHLSSMIISGQITRDEAIIELEKPLYNEEHMENIIIRLLDNIGMSREEFDKVIKQKPGSHSDFKTDRLYAIYKFINKTILK